MHGRKNIKTMLSIVIYHNLMGPPSYMRCVVDRNVVMRRIFVLSLVYQFCDSPLYSLFCIYLLLCLSQLPSPQTQTKIFGSRIRSLQFSLHSWIAPPHSRSLVFFLQHARRLSEHSSSRPKQHCGVRCRGWGKHCVRRFPRQPQMATGTWRWPWAPLHTF